MAALPPGTKILGDATRAALARYLQSFDSEAQAAQGLYTSSYAMVRALAGRPIRQSTAKLIEMRLAEHARIGGPRW